MLKQHLTVCPSLQSTTGIEGKTFHVITHEVSRRTFHHNILKHPLNIFLIAITNQLKKPKKYVLTQHEFFYRASSC